MMKLSLLITAFFELGSFCFANTITVDFSGTISTSSLAGVAVGDPFTGSMTYETTGTVLGSGPGSINYGFYQPQDGVVINVDGFTFAGSSYLNMNIVDPPYTTIPDHTADSLQGSSDGVSGSLFTNYPGLRLDFDLASFSVNPLLVPSNAIPNPFNLADVYLPGTTADPAQVYAQLDNGSSDFTILGNITAASVAPEPSTLLFAGAALAFLFRRRRSGVSKKIS